MENAYTKRKVASAGADSCLVCYKHMTTVLYNKSGNDWFFCCELHLEDNPQFAQPIYSSEYKNALKRLEGITKKIDSQQKAAGASWDQWLNKFLSRKSASDDTDKQDKQDDASKAEETCKTIDTKQSLREQYQEAVDLVSYLRKRCRTYALSDIMFASRVERLKQIARGQEQKRKEQETYSNTSPEDLIAQFKFPEVPKPK